MEAVLVVCVCVLVLRLQKWVTGTLELAAAVSMAANLLALHLLESSLYTNSKEAL